MAEPTTKTIVLNAKPDLTRRYKTLEVAIQLTDAGTPTYTTGGLTIDLTTLNTKGAVRGKIPAGKFLPANNDIFTMQSPADYSAALIQNGSSPTLANFLLKILSAAGTEVASGNLPAALFGATVGASPLFVFRIRTKLYA